MTILYANCRRNAQRYSYFYESREGILGGVLGALSLNFLLEQTFVVDDAQVCIFGGSMVVSDTDLLLIFFNDGGSFPEEFTSLAQRDMVDRLGGAPVAKSSVVLLQRLEGTSVFDSLSRLDSLSLSRRFGLGF